MSAASYFIFLISRQQLHVLPLPSSSSFFFFFFVLHFFSSLKFAMEAELRNDEK
jgi:hypothetical protein